MTNPYSISWREANRKKVSDRMFYGSLIIMATIAVLFAVTFYR
ncbi:MAG: hypothetical protein WC776_05095 [Patescibacteria group bacterium]